jgi:hypothetical protein
MGYLTYRVEITRDEVHSSAPQNIERECGTPGCNIPQFRGTVAGACGDRGRLPQAERIRCYEWSIDDEFPVEKAILHRSGGKWSSAQPPPASDPFVIARPRSALCAGCRRKRADQRAR